MGKHIPIELNEENVLKIYNECLMKKKLSNFLSSDLLSVKIFTKSSCGKDSPEIYFSKAKIKEYGDAIEYMYGQLYDVHHGIPELFPSGAYLDYNTNFWTKNQSAITSFFYLGVANITIMPFSISPKTHQLAVELIDIVPTLSPNDPKFSAWAKNRRF